MYKFMIILGASLLGSIGCKMLQPETPPVANIDKARGEVSFYSSGDPRTTLDDQAKLGDIRAVAERLKKHLRHHRDDYEGMVSLAQAEVALGELDAAEKNCQTVLRHDLKNQPARKILAEVAMRRGNVDMAAIFLNGLGGFAAKDSDVLNMLAMIELGKGNNAGAMSLFKRAIKLNANDLAARMNLGVLLLKYRQMDQAGVEFERVLKAVPSHTDAKLHMAIVKASRGETAAAETMLKEILQVDETNPLALYNLAVIEKDKEKFDDAIQNLKVYLKTPRGKSSDTDKVFALIDDIQRRQAAKGDKVSDEDIQQMALAAKQAPDDASKRHVVKEGTAAAKPNAKPAAKAPSNAPAPARPQQPSTLAIPEDNGTTTNDDIGDLEKALK